MQIPNANTTKLDGFRPLLPAQVRILTKLNATVRENSCIGCGCTDSHGCLTVKGACSWLRVDTQRGLGVCSECEHMVALYDEARRPHGISAK